MQYIWEAIRCKVIVFMTCPESLCLSNILKSVKPLERELHGDYNDYRMAKSQKAFRRAASRRSKTAELWSCFAIYSLQ